MPTFLLIESSGDVCSAAIAKDGKILAEKIVIEPNAHSTYLASFINEVMKNGGLRYADLDAVSIGGGPGSYTGLRIGCSLAKGICYGANASLIACSTLKAIAVAGFEQDENVDIIISLIDARRMDAYVGIYNRKLECLIEEKFVTLDENFGSSFKGSSIGVVGSGAQKWMNEFKITTADDLSETYFSAKHLLPETLVKWESNDLEDVAYYEPNYIKSVFVTKPKPKF